MRRHLLPIVATITATALLSACGDDSNVSHLALAERATGNGSTDGATADFDITMEDIRFSQTSLEVAAGQRVTFRFVNIGQIAHDAFVGDSAAQMDHEGEMNEMAHASDMSGMGEHDAGEPAVVLEPGETGELTYTFDEPGTFEVGCHQPGHYAAGMKIDVTVV
jgi:uncharacterized cupredoxin-like copper-binding protein